MVRPPRIREKDLRSVERGVVGVRREGGGERRERRRGVKRRVRMMVKPSKGCENRSLVPSSLGGTRGTYVRFRRRI